MTKETRICDVCKKEIPTGERYHRMAVTVQPGGDPNSYAVPLDVCLKTCNETTAAQLMASGLERAGKRQQSP